ncbi:N-formylglutamate amidohydrolase [Loktanella sp. S4079]|uniref:N-formylglutamate amidohydrolase n=1 Tax=Loktanella sp. S4079 TaxID=579483 RepID=UPI0005FA7E66|nr:N-formylglutamate amidohydrolase [Loktanella sp. S4079]KJZ17995.1 N-formylglutamate amidohydrolase [Loktanella sp. S4079]
MTQNTPNSTVHILNPTGGSAAILVCEHASCFFPDKLNHLGLQPADRTSHAAWDPGALGVATQMAKRLDATLISSGVSRLVYDCNRPPSAPDAMRSRSELIEIPGNKNLSRQQKQDRTQRYYEPFRAAVAARVSAAQSPIIVTVHSFTPIYFGEPRAVEIGVLHDDDSRLADAMLQTAADHTSMNVQRNDPYGPDDGVTHTLREHALPAGHLNVMLEIRNDLIKNEFQQTAVGDMIAQWLVSATQLTEAKGLVLCVA